LFIAEIAMVRLENQGAVKDIRFLISRSIFFGLFCWPSVT